MLILIWLVLCLVVLSLILLPPAIWLRRLYSRYSGSRLVACPEDQHPAVVALDARHAAATGLHGRADLRLSACTRWPDRASCGQPCLPQALQEATLAPGEGKPGTKPIHHLPILLAAFAAWCLGAIWHSQYLFRARWSDALGLTHAQMKQIVGWLSPHLLTAAACLLFAYGVAWLLVVFHRKGVLPGLLMSLLLAGALALTNGPALAALPHDLLLTEAAYVVLAALTMGAIVGGLSDKLVLPSP